MRKISTRVTEAVRRFTVLCQPFNASQLHEKAAIDDIFFRSVPQIHLVFDQADDFEDGASALGTTLYVALKV